MIRQLSALVVENVAIAQRTFRIRLTASELAAEIRPGQFVMLRLPGISDPLLGRPFALYDTVLDADGKPDGVDIVYLVVGKMTARLSPAPQWRSTRNMGAAWKWFPRHRGPACRLRRRRDRPDAFSRLCPAPARHTRLWRPIAATVGRERHALLRSANERAGGRRRGFSGRRLRSAIGERRRNGRPARLRDRPRRGRSPGRRFRRLRSRTDDARTGQAFGRVGRAKCYLSLETPMACGFGACFSCVTKVKTPSGWDFKRVCVEGPVFNARELEMSE